MASNRKGRSVSTEGLFFFKGSTKMIPLLNRRPRLYETSSCITGGFYVLVNLVYRLRLYIAINFHR